MGGAILFTMKQVQAAMSAMIEKAMQTPGEPVAMAIVDAAGNLEAYAKLDNLPSSVVAMHFVRPTPRRFWARIPAQTPQGYTAKAAASANWETHS